MGQLSFSNDEASKTTLAPLPDGWTSGLLGVGIVGTLSFTSTTILFWYMTYALIGRHRFAKKAVPRVEVTLGQHDNRTPDLSLGLDFKYLVASHSSRNGSQTDVDQLVPDPAPRSRPPSPQDPKASQIVSSSEVAERKPTNPFLILIYNLLVADAISALEFMLCLVWVARDGIFVPSAACTLQAMAAVTGTFAPAVFLTVIALHTYLVIVWGCKIGRRAINLSLWVAWGVIILIPMAALGISRNGADHGGWYVRGDTWCSASNDYATLKLWTEYVPVMVSLAATVGLYALIGVSLMRDRRSVRHLPTSSSTTSESRKELSGHHPAFFVYPVIYLATMAPLGICRVLMMGGRELQEKYYFVSAAIIAAQGLLNCLLWTTTIFFLSREEIEDIGLDDFIRTPNDRVFGNIVYIQGGNKAEEPRDTAQSDRSHRGFVRVASVLGDHSETSRSRRARDKMRRSTSELSLRSKTPEPQGGIQMETITTIIVEDGK